MEGKLWNNLPENFTMNNIKTFKIELKKLLLANPFYRVKEYLRRRANEID